MYGISDSQIINGNIVATCCAILIKIGPVTTNPRDYEGNNCTFLDETAKIGISHQIIYLSNYWTDLHHIFNIGRHRPIYGDYETHISFVVAQGMLLW